MESLKYLLPCFQVEIKSPGEHLPRVTVRLRRGRARLCVSLCCLAPQHLPLRSSKGWSEDGGRIWVNV